MKTLSKILIPLALGLVMLYSCEDDFTEKDAIEAIKGQELWQDSLNNKTSSLSIKVINATGDFATKGHADANVTVTGEGKTVTKKTTADGTATFLGLKKGTYAVNVNLTGFTSVDFTIGTNGHQSVQVPIFQLDGNTMTVKGKVTYETNLLNTTRENAEGVTVMIQPNLPAIFNMAGVSAISYGGYENTATTDADGNYTINVPADKNGKLRYNVSVPVFEANQTLMLNKLNGEDVTGAGNAAKVIPTRFGSNVGTSSPVPNVNPVYCVFSEPTRTFTPAVLKARIYDAKSFDKVYVKTPGKGFANGAYFEIESPDSDEGTSARFQIYTDGQGQRTVEYVTVVNSGSKFTNAELDFDIPVQKRVAKFEVLSTGSGGSISTVKPVGGWLTDEGNFNQGAFLTNRKSDFKVSISKGSAGSTGSGATITIDNFASIYEHGYKITNITPTVGGSGYAIGNIITISLDTDNKTFENFTAKGTLSGGSVVGVIVENPGSGYPKNGSFNLPVKFDAGNAVAEASTDSEGKIAEVNVTNGGSHYTAVPNVTIDWADANKTATANVLVQNGEVKSVVGLEGGNGYLKNPTVTFYSQYAKDNPEITVDHTVSINLNSGKVTNVTINSYTGEKISKNISSAATTGEQTHVSIPGKTTFADFYLGTGVRTAGE